MTDCIETIKKNPKTQKEVEMIVDKLSYESYRTQTQMGQNVLIQRKNHEKK